MYRVNHVIKLDGRKFYDVSIWNMFSRRKAMAVVLLVGYAFGLGSIVTALPALKAGNTNGFIINAGIGVVMLVMAAYLIYSNISRLKRVSRNEEYLAKTEKHIKMDEDQIINYRAAVDEQVAYKWSQVDGIYDRKDDIVFSLKDKQMLVLEKSKLQAGEEDFIRAKADVLMLWRKPVDARIWIAAAVLITIAMAAAGVWIYLR